MSWQSYKEKRDNNSGYKKYKEKMQELERKQESEKKQTIAPIVTKTEGKNVFNELIGPIENNRFIKQTVITPIAPAVNQQTVSEEDAKKNYINYKKNRATNTNEYTPVTKKVNKSIENATSGVRNAVSNFAQNLVKSSEAFDDGYQFGDVTKTVGSTLGNIVGSVKKGYENIKNSTQNVISEGVSDLVGDKTKIVKNILNQNVNNLDVSATGKISGEELQNKTNKNSILGKSSQQVLEGVGYSAGLGLAQTVGGPVLMNALTFASAVGSTLDEINGTENMTISEKWQKALTGGAVETITENLFGLFGKTGLDDKIANKLASKVTTGLNKALIRQGVMMGSEAAEELISAGLNQGADIILDAINKGGADFYSKYTDEDWEELWTEAITAGVSAGISGAGTTINNVNDISKQTNTNFKESLNTYEKELDNEYKKEQYIEELDNYKKKAQKELNKTTDERNKQILQAQISQIDSRLEELGENASSESKIKGFYNTIKQTISKNAKIENNTISNETNDLSQKQLENNKIFEESIKKYNENHKDNQIDIENDGIKQIKKFADKTNNQIEFSDEFKDDKILSKYEDGKIIINAKSDSNKSLQNIAIHEAIHSKSGTKEFDKLVEQVLNYAKTKGEYETARNDLNNLYAEEYKNMTAEQFDKTMDEEVVTNILGEYFGSEEKLNQLIRNIDVKDRRGFIEKTIDLVKNIINKVTGYKNQEQYFKKVQRQLESVLANEEVTVGNKYMNIGLRGFENAKNNINQINNLENYKKYTELKDTKLGPIDGSFLMSEEKTFNPSRKAQEYEKRKNVAFKRNISAMLGISQFNQNNKEIFNETIDKIRKEYNKNKKIKSETRDLIFNNMYNNLIKKDNEYYSENKDIKKQILDVKLYIPNDVKYDVGEFKEFKEKYFGDIKMTDNESDTNIDSFYQELSSQRPDLFPSNITTQSDQLIRIAEVSKSIRKSERNVSSYNDYYLGKEYREWAKYEFNNQLNILLKEYKIVDNYNEDKNKIKPEYVRPDVKEIKWVYQNREMLRKEVEKLNNSILLTDREKILVDRLLNNEIEMSEILPGVNKEAIAKAYTTKQAYKYVTDQIDLYKKSIKQDLKDEADSLTINARSWRDKKKGLLYSRETAQRNNLDIMSKEDAQKINELIFDPVIHNTSEQIRFLNDYAQKINDLNIDKKNKYNWINENKEIKINEADLAQLLIEKKIDDNFLKENNANIEKIHKIADVFSEILNDTVNMMDDVYVSFGYPPVLKRQNYFPHFIENKPDSFIGKFANTLGFNIDADALPTDIAGRTETFKPGRAFDRNILQRTTEKTDINALKALDMYMQGASDIIYHTADIQKVRALGNSIRDMYKDKIIKEKLQEIDDNTDLTNDERAEQKQKIREQIKTPLGNYVTWLDSYANSLANKKDSGDRQMEKDWGRQSYITMKDIESKISSNLVGGNLSVAITNFAPLFQAMGTTKIGDLVVGMIQTTKNNVNKLITNNSDNFDYMSDFLTSRRGNELTQKQTASQRFSNLVSKPMEIIDNFTSEAIVRAKYRENLKKGMSNEEAIKKADTYARNLMADRSKGALPIYFDRKNPFTKLITSFQVEPNNIISNYFKDMPRNAESEFQLVENIVKLSVASYAFNTLIKSIRGGSDVIPDPINLVSNIIKLFTNRLDDDDENDDEVTVFSIANDLLGSLPFGSSVAVVASALGVDEFKENGRLMVTSAVPDFTKVNKLFDKETSKEYKNQVVMDELSKPFLYLVLPTGGAQVSKTVKGIKSYIEGGSYKYTTEGEKQLQFPIAPTIENATKSSIFGKYSTNEGKMYIENGFNGLNANQTELYEATGIDFNTIKTYFNETKNAQKEEKLNYINSMNINQNQKWIMYQNQILSEKQNQSAELLIRNGLTDEKQYMDIYNTCIKNNISMPSLEKSSEMVRNKVSLLDYFVKKKWN